jgi:hypothetical protein
MVPNYLKWIALALVTLRVHAASLEKDPLVFSGMCDASAAVALSGDLFGVVNDEDNIFRFYRSSRPGPPVQTIDLKPLLSNKRKKAPEADFEGAARLGNRVFLITSHGRNASGKPAPLRHRLLAVELTEQAGRISATPIGQPYTNLLADLAKDSRFGKFGFVAGSKQAPKTDGGLNIEALTDTPDGHLLIGFRNPVFEGRAIIIPLLNPAEVIEGQPPRFGDAMLLDLGGLGLRGIGSMKNGYYLIGGPTGSAGECRMFTWQGSGTDPKLVDRIRFPGINPEGICFHDQGPSEDFLILSDDGTRQISGKDCKTLPESQRQFRAYRVKL